MLEQWGQKMAEHCGTDTNVIFFTDGKPWKMLHPGRSRAVQEICLAAGVTDVNLMQRAYCNGHYKYHGGKIQHVLQADGIVHSFTCPIRNHDALLLRNSSMLLMLSSVFINGDPNQPAVTVMDKAYGRSAHFKPFHTEAELRMLAPADRVIEVNFDRWHKRPRLTVEDSFNQHVSKFPHAEVSKWHRIMQGGRSNWNYLRCLWDIQTLFSYLFTSSAGSQVTGALGVHPSSVHEYLFSCNNDLLIDVPLDDAEDEFLNGNDYYI